MSIQILAGNLLIEIIKYSMINISFPIINGHAIKLSIVKLSLLLILISSRRTNRIPYFCFSRHQIDIVVEDFVTASPNFVSRPTCSPVDVITN